MKSVVVEGNSVEDAIQDALNRLEAQRDQVDIEVLEEGSRGFLGLIGAKSAKVRVNLKVTPESALREFLNNVIKALEMDAGFNVWFEDDYWRADFFGKDIRFIIGRRGETLNSLQLLTNLAVNKQLEDRVRVVLDAEGYRGRREETLRRLARRIADRVQRTKKDVMLEPMPPQERRIIHLELQNNQRVATRSKGREPYRKVVIFYKNKEA